MPRRYPIFWPSWLLSLIPTRSAARAVLRRKPATAAAGRIAKRSPAGVPMAGAATVARKFAGTPNERPAFCRIDPRAGQAHARTDPQPGVADRAGGSWF